MIRRLLIANRGEIAVRIARACRELGIESVAVYSDADRDAAHVQAADRAVRIGPAPPAESYLDARALVEAARGAGADAVHPGYGFLSENAEFARRLQQAGVTLIGPSPEAVKKMGDKIESKKIAVKAGVSTVPGTLDVISTPEQAKKVEKEIGFPMMIKAAASALA